VTTRAGRRLSVAGPRAEDPGREAWELLLQLFHAERGTMRAVWSELELTPPQAFLLQHLDAARPAPMGELADTLACDASNVTGLVDKLEARGLIERRADPRDRRVKMVALTDAGARLRRRLVDRLHEPPSWIAALSSAKKAALRDLLRKAVRWSRGD
jgi:DNA-binding MarR family transcriptional regulator